MGAQRRVDSKGRVTLPTEIREQLGLEPGSTVSVDLADDEVVIRPEVDRREAAQRLKGCVNDDTRSPNAADLDPEDLKEDWTSDLP